jgi:type I restriction enzyme S subunit
MIKINEYSFSSLYDIASGISTSKSQAGHGSPFVSFSTVFNNYFLPNELPDLMDTSKKEQEIYSIKTGDILLTRTSETIDELAMSCVATKDYPEATFSGFTKRLRYKHGAEKVAYHKYIGFYLRGYLFRKAVTNHSIMTLRSSFNEEIFSLLNIYLPEYEEQVKIGDFLYALQQKTVLNNIIVGELEKLAKILYNYWFVQFDFPNAKGKPYRASGGKMEYNEVLKREIPKGWEIKHLKDICRIKSGYPFNSKSYLKNGRFRLITIKNVQEDGVNLNVDSFIDTIPDNMPEYCLLNPGDILMSLTGNVGRVGLMFENDCLLNQRVAVIKPVSEAVKWYSYFLLKSDHIRASMENMANGSSQDNLSPIDTENILLPFDSVIVNAYNTKMAAIIQQIVSLKMQNKVLTELRDFLLPLLMNGQVSVSKEITDEDDGNKLSNDKGKKKGNL